ncbi:MAG TPA: DUF362 domain-containing protein [Thermoanaerobaculales bacterium]|nr:DUF362 domain-containing protein [Thermoanaerobaculales bacterium]HPA79968.1 DUF362 domain-containing protein [Thermoanaerobaculales bacterium]HQN96685.1 DUF362 domain-containing protein [Thermoanaerobaculales bacterium]HQP43381.1 DUF362 domain-containing protein [Thermoanaerobaculales bacterium]
MFSKANVITRRDFVRAGSGLAAAGLLTGVGRPGAWADGEPARSRVVLVRRQDALGEDGSPNGPVLHDMLNEAVAALLGVAEPAAAWQRLIRAGDVVGIKTNAWRQLPTPAVLEEAIRAEVIAAGAAPGDVAVDDRGVRENPVFKRATAYINVRPMRTHHWSGLGTCLKNMIMFVPQPSEYHGDACASLGAIWRLPEIEGKVRLNVLVMLTPQFHGVGPHSFSPAFVWPYKGLLVGIDPVAVDATGARIIEAKRREHFGEERPISPPPHHIQIADTRYGLGVSDPARIDVVRLGWTENALI